VYCNTAIRLDERCDIIEKVWFVFMFVMKHAHTDSFGKQKKNSPENMTDVERSVDELTRGTRVSFADPVEDEKKSVDPFRAISEQLSKLHGEINGVRQFVYSRAQVEDQKKESQEKTEWSSKSEAVQVPSYNLISSVLRIIFYVGILIALMMFATAMMRIANTVSSPLFLYHIVSLLKMSSGHSEKYGLRSWKMHSDTNPLHYPLERSLSAPAFCS
jgi:hypothetical protein